MNFFPPIILASASPRRRDLLAQWGIPFQVFPADIEELDAHHHNVDEMVLQNALLKASWVAEKLQPLPKNALVLGADTLVCFGQKVYGKPANLAAAHQYLSELGGVTHTVLTGFALVNGDGACFSQLVRTLVTLRPLTADQRDELFAKVDPLDKAAAYGYQDAPWIVESLQGSKTNVFGLPMLDLVKAILGFEQLAKPANLRVTD